MELLCSRYAGDQLITHNFMLNVDVRAYHAYSFETVAESDSGRLIEEFLHLPLPRLFLHGEANQALPYLPRLRDSAVFVAEIPRSAHFLFYDNPVATFQAIGEFMHAHVGEGTTKGMAGGQRPRHRSSIQTRPADPGASMAASRWT